MFGLMKFNHCTTVKKYADVHRLHYCGTCKAMGKLFGNRARLFLNDDVVFFAEILSEIKLETDYNNWDQSALAGKCLKLPEEDSIPDVLRYSALLNTLLAVTKIRDNRKDNRGLAWRLAERLFRKEYRKAEELAGEFNFPMEEFSHWVQQQDFRESLPPSAIPADPEKAVAFYSEPTGKMTELTMGFDPFNIENNSENNPLSQLGRHFGRLVYLLDALEDYEKDTKRNRFNAIQKAYNIDSKTLPAELKAACIIQINHEASMVESVISGLGMNSDKRDMFINRLKSNLSARLNPGAGTACGLVRDLVPKLSLREKWIRSRDFARLLAERMCLKNGPALRVRLAVTTFVLWIIPYAAWAQASSSESECWVCECFYTVLGAIVCFACARYGCSSACCQGCALGSVLSCFMCGGDK